MKAKVFEITPCSFTGYNEYEDLVEHFVKELLLHGYWIEFPAELRARYSWAPHLPLGVF